MPVRKKRVGFFIPGPAAVDEFIVGRLVSLQTSSPSNNGRPSDTKVRG
jgi:hypothetical protein